MSYFVLGLKDSQGVDTITWIKPVDSWDDALSLACAEKDRKIEMQDTNNSVRVLSLISAVSNQRCIDNGKTDVFRFFYKSSDSETISIILKKSSAPN